MPILPSIILAIVQGISEFLPISSTGHLALAQAFFGFTPSLTLDVFLHLATLLAVLFFFRSQISYFFTNLKYIIVASIPAALVGVLFKHQIEAVFSSNSLLPYFFLITATLILSTYFLKAKNQALDFKKSLIIGLIQAIAILPGVSRSGSTIFAGLLVGLSPLNAFNFSFCLFIPATLGAALLEARRMVLLDLPSLIPAFIICFFVGLATLAVLKKILISRHFWLFGFYTLALAIFLLIFP